MGHDVSSITWLPGDLNPTTDLCHVLYDVQLMMFNDLCRTIDGEKMEPLEEVMCELEDEFSGPVIDALSLRKGEVLLAPRL